MTPGTGRLGAFPGATFFETCAASQVLSKRAALATLPLDTTYRPASLAICAHDPDIDCWSLVPGKLARLGLRRVCASGRRAAQSD